MIFLSTCFPPNVFLLLTLIVVQSVGELIVRLHPPENDGFTRDMTCLSKNDDAALIWNTREASFTDSSDFQPTKAGTRNVSGCAIWDSKDCVARWKDLNGWDEVDSMIHPMGPVFDYRWESLKEFHFGNNSNEHGYRYVGRVNESSGMIIVSARGSEEVNLFLCKRNRPTEGPCVWIRIHRSRISMVACTNQVSGCSKLTEEDSWRNIVDYDATNISDNLDPYEWRTFEVKWNKERNVIEIFNNKHVILNGTLRHRGQISHVWVTGLDAWIRFHSYKYLLTRKTGSVILTSEFIRYNEALCVEMLVGLCSGCELNVNVVDTANQETLLKHISADQSSLKNEPITWRPIQVQVNRQSSGRSIVRLKISTALKNGNGYGRWAIDNFRMCQPQGTRESTITIRREKSFSWPRITCQKLSYTENEVIDSSSSMQCRGTIECFIGRHGHDYYSRKRRVCKCRSRNKRSTAIPEVQDLILTSVSATAVTLEWKPPENVDGIIVGYNVSIEVKYLLGCAESNRSTPEQKQPRPQFVNQTKASFEGLHPHAWYIATVVAHTASEKGSPKTFPFRTNETHIPTSIIHNFRIEERGTILRWDWPKECITITGVVYYTKLKFQSANDIIRNSTLEYTTTNRNFTLSELYLIPGVKYTVRAYVTRAEVETENLDKYASLTWTIPRGVTELEAYDTDCEKNTTSLRFIPPVLFDDQVKSYYGTITEENKPPNHVTFNNSAKLNCDLWDDRTCLEDLYLPSNAALDIKIHATGKKDNGFETSSNITFSLEESCKTNLSWQVNFTLTKNCGLVKLRWKKPLPIPTKITRFIIRVDPLDRHQLDNSTLEFPIIEEIHAESKRKEYTTEFSLPEGRTYNISLIAFDQRNISSMENTAQLSISKECALENQVADAQRRSWKQYLPYVTIFPIIVIFLLLLFVYYRRRRRFSEEPYYEQIDELTLRKQNNNTTMTHSSLENQMTTSEASTNTQGNIEVITAYAEPLNSFSCKVKVEEFEEYVKEALASGLLDAQYTRLSSGPSLPRVCGSLPENEYKNRHSDVIPYDDNRVVLTKIPNDPHSDYINASYIEGYRKTRAYIATQGPKSNTVKDFWRMIWQEDVRVICMLTNLVEDRKVKSEKYWPEVGTKVKYGDILISNTGHEVFADYTIRTLVVDCQNKRREITHLHYTGWPDHGVPMYTQSLVAYLKKVLATPTGKGPVVVHCGAGVGRTGTIILCDICLRQAVIERVIDVPTIIVRLRDGRLGMVDNSQQYLLAHLTIMESMVSTQTQTPCSDGLWERIQELSKQLPSDMERLNDTVWQDRVLHALAPPQRPTRVQENGMTELESGTENGQELSTFDSESNYIDVVSVDGVRSKKQYLASHLPSNSTVSEIWRLVAEKNVELITVLQSSQPDDPTHCDIVPDESTFVPVPNIRLKTNSVDAYEHFTIRTLELEDTSEEKVNRRPVTVLECSGWGCREDEKPPHISALVSLWQESAKIRRKEGPTLVLCRDGITACGVYLALSFLLERMAVERECDVISAVRAVRRSRPEFVQSVEQFVYLYAAAAKYYDDFREYANFT